MNGYNKGVLFDLDGTCVWTKLDHITSLVNKTLKHHKKEEVHQDTAAEFWFGHGRAAFVTKKFGLKPEDFWKVLNVLDTTESRLQHTEVYSDVVDFMTFLKDRGYKIGIVTGAQKIIADCQIKLLGDGFIDRVVYAKPHLGVREKPDPHGIEICLADLELSPKNTIYVGNASEDILAARGAKTVDVLVQRPEYTFHDALALNPSHVITNFHELSSLLEKYS